MVNTDGSRAGAANRRVASWHGGLRAFYLFLAISASLLALLQAPQPGKALERVVHGVAGEEVREQAQAKPSVAPEQRAVAEFIAKRYRVAEQPVTEFVLAAYRAGQQFALDPLLILAVMAVESRYNPVAQSEFGAKGLMQIIPRFHADKLRAYGGEAALLDPEVNIQIGARILREYLRKFGETETALQMYAGAFDEPTSQYATRVLNERSRLQQILQRPRRDPKPQTTRLGSASPAEPG